MFNPTDEQAQAVNDIINWFRGKKPDFYVLKGYAGTGKTYLMTHLARTGLKNAKIQASQIWSSIGPSQICFTAPTNKAVKVLRNYLDDSDLNACRTATIYSLLGLSLQPNGEVRELKSIEDRVDLSSYKLIVVDEASMVNRHLMSEIRKAYSDWRVPFLFMGDPAQLPPVGEPYTPVWKIENVSELTQVMRYGNSMLDLATAIRRVVDHPFPSIKIQTSPPVFRKSRKEWLDSMFANIDLFKSGEGKAIAWRNVTVDGYNRVLRRAIFGADQANANVWLPGDQIIAAAPLKGLDDEIFMRTDEEATILDVSIGNHPRYSEYEVWNLSVRDEQGQRVIIRSLTPAGGRALGAELTRLHAEAKGGKRHLWGRFWQLREAFHDIKYSYAITTHRSQGSSYRKTWVDLEDIMMNRNRSEAFRSLYVACTRQREELYIS